MSTPDRFLGVELPSPGEMAAPAPPPPQSMADTGLSDSQVLDLMLKTLFLRGNMKGNEISGAVALPLPVIDDLLLTMTERHFVEVKGTQGHGRGGYTFELSEAGHHRAQAALDANRYVGPAPVSLDQFREWVRLQSVRSNRVWRDQLEDAFKDLVLHDEVFDALGPALNSGGSIFLHGAAGNGKTAIAERLGALVSTEVYLPHAVMVGGHVMVVMDHSYHHRLDGPAEEWEVDSEIVLKQLAFDQRFVRVRRPTVFVGGELSMDQLDLRFNEYSKVYQAPFQVKAAGGVLIIDDFGRQRMGPAELLNRWIVPLEKGFDNLTLESGLKFSTPFDCILIFATNLNPRDLVDEAFLRRIQYKVEVRSPGRKAFEKILMLNCDESGIEYRQEAVDLLYSDYYDKYGVRPRGCHPRDILHHIQSIASYEGLTPSLEEGLLRRAAMNYFLVMEEEFQPGIAAITPGIGEPA